MFRRIFVIVFTIFFAVNISLSAYAAVDAQADTSSSTSTNSTNGDMSSIAKYGIAAGIVALGAGAMATVAILNKNKSSSERAPTPAQCTLSAPTNVQTSNITQTSADVSWTAATSSCNETITYTVKAIRVSDSAVIATVTTTGLSVSLTGLTLNTPYQAQVTAQDQTGNTTTASTNFTTCNPKIYVPDSANNRIQKFDTSGTFLTKWGSAGTDDGQFQGPFGVAVDSSGNVYVTDSSNDRIQKFDSNGTFIKEWGSFGTGDGEFNTPTGVAVDSSGNVYVADTNNNRIQKFDSNGNFITKWGSNGAGDGQFNSPGLLAVGCP